MDEFLDPHWNLEQVRSWVETRDAEAVRFAAIPKQGRPKYSSEIVAWCVHAAGTLAAGTPSKNGRDVGAELWAASGWPPPSNKFEASPMARRLANEADLPIYFALDNKDAQIRLPKRAHTDGLFELWMAASESESALMNELAHAYSQNTESFKSDSRLERLSPELRRLAIEYFSAPEPHGPPHVFIRGTFPTIRYLEHLFRTGGLRATANLPGDPRAYALSNDDWAGLEIASGGYLRRLSVWRSEKVSATGEGDFENVRVARDAVLKAFPADPPSPPTPAPIQPTDEDARRVIREGMASRGGFISQKDGAKIVRGEFPDFNATRAMELTKDLTKNTKPGPRGPRRTSSE